MNPLEVITMTTNDLTRVADGKNWQSRHLVCWGARSASPAAALRDAIVAWANIAEAHDDAFSRRIGDDSVLGAAWKQMGHALITMLNGDLGGLDGGTLDKLIRDIAVASHVDLDE
jgi:hypothetical protein